MKNPVTAILRSNALRGVKIIALSLLVVLVSAAPIMIYSLIGSDSGNPVALAWLFACGAVVAHIGFIVGILLIIWDIYFRKK